MSDGRELDRPGVFRGRIVEFGLSEAQSGAQGVSLVVNVDEQWDESTKTWLDWREYCVDAKGILYVVKKDGTLNNVAIESLVSHAGWDGDLTSIVNGTWKPTPCQFVVNEEKPNDYHDDSRYRVSFINAYDRTPGAVGNVTPDKAKALQAKYGSQIRALVGNVARNSAPPASSKPKPEMPGAPRRKPNSPPYPHHQDGDPEPDGPAPWETDDNT